MLQQTRDRAVADDKAERAAALGRAAMRADEDAEAGRIEKLELREIDDEMMAAVFRRVAQRGAHRRRRREIEAAAQLEDQRVATVLCLEVNT